MLLAMLFAKFMSSADHHHHEKQMNITHRRWQQLQLLSLLIASYVGATCLLYALGQPLVT